MMALEDVPGTRWLLTEEIREDSPIRLFCFPGSSGLATEFSGWSNRLTAENVECYCFQLPGSGSRRFEPAFLEAEGGVDLLVTEMLKCMDKPFAFLGREDGSQVCLALALELQARGLPLPRRLFVNDSTVGTPQVKVPCDGDKTRAAFSQSLRAFMAKSRSGGGLTCPVTLFGTCPSSSSGEMDAAIERLSRAVNGRVDKVHLPPSSAAGDEELIKVVDGVLCDDATKSREESVKLVHKWNSGTQKYPDRSCLHDMFRESASKNRDATAIVYKGASLTFGEVDDLTDLLAGWLYSKGVRVGSTVGIFMEHRTEYALAYIAAHKATGAYMPLELVYPADLLEGVMRQVKPPVVLTQSSVVDRLPSWQTSLCMDDDGEWIKAAEEAPAVPVDAALPTPDDLAYVVMSSGTTGAPKGICCPHRGAVHSYHHRLVNFPYEEGDREACHVFFVWELLRPLLGGMDSAGGVAVPLYVIPDDHIYDPPRLLKYLGENAITRMLFTPSLLQLVLDQCEPGDLREGMKTMKIVWLCGEVVTVELRNKFKALLPNCHMENLYSISECHDISFCNLDELDTTESPKYAPCGKVVPNVRAYILDEQLQQVPVGVPGRMWIAGPTLAIGYLNMPERTAERFVPDPFAEAEGRKGERMYDTGDRCRYLPSGSIEVIGRCDFMVKVRGYSVVIGAVEAAITEHPLVSTAIVMTEGAEGSMDKKLVAYIVPDRWDKLPSARSIKTFLKSRLPPYAVPHVCILLDAIPINMASGKADKKKLPKSCNAEVRFAPHSCAHDHQLAEETNEEATDTSTKAVTVTVTTTKEVTTPKTPKTPTTPNTSTSFFAKEEEEEHAPNVPTLTSTQRSVAKLWARLLKVDEATIQPSSDFFDLGGHSLLLAKLSAALLKDVGAVVSIPAIIERPTLAELAELLDDEMTRTSTNSSQGEARGGSDDGSGSGSASVILSTPALRAVGKAWCRVLDPGVESSLSPAADFFDLGGHSLLLAKLAKALTDETGVTLTLQEIVERSTLDGMARLLEKAAPGTFSATPSVVPALGLEAAGGSGAEGGGEDGVGHDPLVLRDGSMGVVKCADGGAQGTAVTATAVARVLDLEAEARRLDASIYPASTRKFGYSRFRATSVRPPQRVFLTGASGFLGAHILKSLLTDTHVDVFCLVRAGNEEEALVRLEDTLHKYKLDGEEVLSSMDRVTAVPGDLSRPLLGLDNTAFKMLAGVVDAIIHSGASVNLVRSYQSLKAVNVLGTQEVLRLAVTNAFGTRVKPVHFVSTNGIFPFSSEIKTFKEEVDTSNLWKDLSDGYGQSKWVAEQMCVDARSRGLPVSILRPGNMAPSARTGVWNRSDFIYMLLQGCLELGCVPEGVQWHIDVTPVDFAARAMVHVAVEQPTKSLGHVLHIQNPAKMQKFEDVAGWLKEGTGAQLEGVSLDEFKARLGKAVDEKGPKDGGILAQLEAGLDGFAYYLTDPPHLDCAWLTAALEGSSIECPSLDKDLVAIYASTLSTLASGRE